MNGAQAGTVAQLGAQLGELGVKIGNVYLAQACLAKLGGDVLHFAWNGGVVIGGGHVVGADLNEHERVAVILKVELELLGLRLGLILKVHVGKAAQAHSGLVHKTAGLAIVVVLGALAHLGECDGLNRGRAPERLHGAAVSRLDSSGARKSATRGNGAGKGEVEALGLNTKCYDLVGHTAHEACGRALLGLLNIQRVERNLKRGVALVGDADLVGVGCYGDAVNGDIERASDNVAALVIGVIAADLGTPGRVHVEHLAVADGAKLLLKQLGEGGECLFVGGGHMGPFLDAGEIGPCHYEYVNNFEHHKPDVAAPHVNGYVNVLITQRISIFENLVIGRFSAVNGVAVWTYGAKEPLIEKVEYVNMRPTIADFGAGCVSARADIRTIQILRERR